MFLLKRRKMDDPVGATAAHGAAGGVIAGGGFGQLAVQLGGGALVLSTARAGSSGRRSVRSWACEWTRPTRTNEDEGVDVAECGAPAYGEELPAMSLS